ncbi:MAG: porin family protein [Gallionella sp.]|nr:porin family protein [Gallionella sp.]
MKKIAAALLLSTAVAAPVFAAEAGPYAGVTLGRSHAGNDGTGGVQTKNTDTVLGVLGGYQFTKNWGAEVFYTDLGRGTGGSIAQPTAVSGKSDAWGINAVGTLPLSDAFSLYGKLGYASTKTKLSAPAGWTITGATRNAATYGLGGVYNVKPAIGIRFGWDHYGMADANGVTLGVKNNFNTNVWSLGAVFKF